MKSPISSLASKYVNATKELSEIRENNFLAFFFDKLKFFMQKIFADAPPSTSLEEKLKALQKIINDNAENITDELMLGHKTELVKSTNQALKANEKVHKAAEQIRQLNKAEIEKLTREIIKNEVLLSVNFNNGLLKKMILPDLATPTPQ
jgi:hypothetical protein